MRAVDGSADVVHRGFGRVTALLGLAAGAQAADAQLDVLVRVAALQGLRVGVGANELHALHTTLHHVGDRIATAAADTDHLDLRALVEFFDFDHFDGHF
ncbi:hypothetical protein D9M69_537470 [compost metagenome]